MTEQDIFEAILERDREQRAAYLAEVCGTNLELRRRMEKLLEVHENAGQFLEKPAGEIVATQTMPPVTERPGTQIGPYKLLEEIGEGGMGLVFMAEQQHPVRRLVALKLVKPGMDSKQVVARFEAERQALAMMDHPNIAHVLDAGTTDSGRPYFVMELVRGIPIHEFCDQKKLTVRQRLELFIQVCQAVQHAHQKGIIHRDLKPTNVLVTLNDVQAVPKVIDFGIAKALGQSLTELTLHTGFAQLVGTPAYMSPEQAEMNQLGVDTRSDVYSLGVLLYELLTGTTPFDKEAFSKVGLDEMRRMIREDDPPRPSARVSTLEAQALTTISQKLGADPRRISATLRGELDWIVMKSLEKDRSRRYESASAFATDIQRYLSDEPVHAYPPTAMYRFQKFARKHKPTLTAAAVIAAVMILGTMVSAWQAVRATAAEGRAAANEQKAIASSAAAQEKEQEAKSQAQEANQQRDEVRALNNQLRRTLYVTHMNLVQRAWEDGNVDRVLELLDRYRPQAGQEDLRGFEWYYWDRLCHSELLTLKGHKEAVTDMAFSPDGTRIASAARDGVKVWDAATGKEIRTLERLSPASRVVFSTDGQRLGAANIAGGSDESDAVKIWDAGTGQEIFTWEGRLGGSVVASAAASPPPPVNKSEPPAFSPDLKRLALASPDGSVRLWDTTESRELFALKGDSDCGRVMTFSPDGRRLAAASGNGIVSVWDTDTGREVFVGSTFRGAWGGQQLGDAVAFSPDGRWLTLGGHGGVKVWDMGTGEEVFAYLTPFCNGSRVAFSPCGWLAWASSDLDGSAAGLRVWDTATRRENFSWKGGARLGIHRLAFSQDGKWLAWHTGTTLRLWDAASSLLWHEWAHQEPLALKGNSNDFSSVAFSPDGGRLASSVDNTVKVWDIGTLQNPFALEGRVDPVHGVACSRDGRQLALAGISDVEVWDLAKGQKIRTLIGVRTRQAGPTIGRGTGCSAVAFSPDGGRLASANGHGIASVWDTSTGQEIFVLEGHTGAATCVAFSADGTRVAAGGWDRDKRLAVGAVNVWNAATGRKIFTLEAKTGEVHSVVFSPDGRRLVWTDGATVKLSDAAAGQDILDLKGHTGNVSSVAFNPDGRWLASAGEDGVRIWDAATGQEILDLRGHTGNVRSVVFSPDGRRLASAGEDGVKVWDAVAGREILSLKGHAANVHSVAFSPDGAWLVSGGTDGATFWDASPRKTGDITDTNPDRKFGSAWASMRRTLPSSWPGAPVVAARRVFKGHEGIATYAVFSADGNRVLSSGDTSVRLWDVETGKPLRKFDGPGGPLVCCLLTKDGKRAIGSGLGEKSEDSIWVWDVETGNVIRRLAAGRGWAWRIAISPDETRLLSTGLGNALRLWDLDAGKVIRTFETNIGGGGRGAAFSPDGKRVVSSSWDGTVRVWDVETGREIRQLKGHAREIDGITFTPDGRHVLYVLSGDGKAGTVLLCDVETGQEVRRFEGHTRAIWNIAVSPDGQRLLSAGGDGTARIWDLASGRQLQAFVGHHGAVRSATFSPDGRWAISASRDQTLRLWPVP